MGSEVLFIKPPFFRLLTSEVTRIPILQLYQAAVLRENGISSKVFDADFDYKNVLHNEYINHYKSKNQIRAKKAWEDIKDVVRKHNPRLVCLDCASSQGYFSVIKTASIIKKEFGIPIVLTGVHATYKQAETSKNPLFNAVIIGEAENSIYKVVSTLLKDPTRKFEAPVSSPPADLNELPFPAREFLINKKLYPPYTMGLILTSRGCPNQCSFCASPFKLGPVRFRSHQSVVEEIKLVRDTYGTRDFTFYDDLFTISHKHVRGICRSIISEGLNISWMCLSRADTLNRSLIRLMRRAGCRQIRVGIESGNQGILNAYNKNLDLKRVIKISKLIKEEGIELYTTFIVGHFNETRETVLDSLNLIKKIRPDYVTVTTLHPLPGTRVYEEALNRGLVDEKWYLDSDATFNLTEIPEEEFSRLVNLFSDYALKLNRKNLRLRLFSTDVLKKSPSMYVKYFKELKKLF